MSQLSLTSSAHMAAIRLKSANKYIFRALLSIASATLLSRLMGMVNQIIVTSHFGAGATMDAYFIASTTPTILAYLLISTLETTVIPIYARIRTEESRASASQLLSTLLNLLLIGTLALTAILLLFRREIIVFSAPALDSQRMQLAMQLAPLACLVVTPMVIIGFLECILNTEGQFGLPAYAGLLVPLTTAVFVLILGKTAGVTIFCVGNLVGLGLQLATFVLRLRRAKITYRCVLNLHHPALRPLLSTAWPVLLGSLIGQISPLTDQIFASFLSVGSISALSYSLKLVSVCSGVIFAAVGRAALPYLSRQAAIKDMQAFKNTLRLYLWIVGLCTLALSLLLIIFAHPIVQVLFQRGAFSALDTQRTATTLIGFMIGLTPMSLGILTAKAFSALGRTKVLMMVSILSMITNVGLDALFAHLWGGFGIALATSTYYMGTMLLLFFLLQQTMGRLDLLQIPSEFKELQQKLVSAVSSHGLDKNSTLPISQELQRSSLYLLVCVGTALLASMGVVQNALYTLRLAIGSIFMLLLLRYHYALLITWILISALLSPNLPLLTNNNIFTGLTIPTILLLLQIPVRQLILRMTTLRIFFLYLLWVLVGFGITSIGFNQFLTTWLTYFNYFAVALLTLSVLTSQQRLHRTIDTLLWGATFVSLYGIYGYLTQQNGVFDPQTSLFRIFSIFSAAPPLALFLSVVLPLALYRGTLLHGWQRWLVGLQTLIFFIALVLTFTRGAFVSLPLSLTLMILFHPSRRVKISLLVSIILLSLGVILITSLINLPLFSRFMGEDVGSLNGRTYLWQALLDHFDPTQILGHGLKSADMLLHTLQVGFDGNVIATAPSNLFLGTLYDHGIIGLALLSLLFLSLVFHLFRGIKLTRGRQRGLYVAALAVLLNVFLQSFEVDDLWTQAIGLYFWIIMVLPFAQCWNRKEALAEISPEEQKGKDTSQTVTRSTRRLYTRLERIG